MRQRRGANRDGACVCKGGEWREDEEEGVDVASEEGHHLAAHEAIEQWEEQWRGEDLHGRETRVHPAQVAGGEVEPVMLRRVDEPHGIDSVLAALDDGVQAVHQAGDEHVTLADELDVAALVELEDVTVINGRHIVGVRLHDGLELLVACL